MEMSNLYLKVFMNARRRSQYLNEHSIMDIVCEVADISRDRLLSTLRHRPTVAARAVFMKVCKEYTTLTLRQIGDYVGGRDHSTVLHNIENVHNSLQLSDPVSENIALIYKKVKRKIKNGDY